MGQFSSPIDRQDSQPVKNATTKDPNTEIADPMMTTHLILSSTWYRSAPCPSAKNARGKNLACRRKRTQPKKPITPKIPNNNAVINTACPRPRPIRGPVGSSTAMRTTNQRTPKDTRNPVPMSTRLMSEYQVLVPSIVSFNSSYVCKISPFSGADSVTEIGVDESRPKAMSACCLRSSDLAENLRERISLALALSNASSCERDSNSRRALSAQWAVAETAPMDSRMLHTRLTASRRSTNADLISKSNVTAIPR